MHLHFIQSEEELRIRRKEPQHMPPHVHPELEIIHVLEGSMVLGEGQELYELHTGDVAFVFPHIIHHYQVFSSGRNRIISMLANPVLGGVYQDTLARMCPVNPVIPAAGVHPDIPYALQALIDDPADAEVNTVNLCFVQLILARAIPLFSLADKESIGSDDIIYRTVSYIADHYRENLSLESIGKSLGYSPFQISRVFSGTFHMNFNQFVNDMRLNYAVGMMQYTAQSLTDICFESGFESQRTFNRVFKERFRMPPREYRKLLREAENKSANPDLSQNI